MFTHRTIAALLLLVSYIKNRLNYSLYSSHNGLSKHRFFFVYINEDESKSNAFFLIQD